MDVVLWGAENRAVPLRVVSATALKVLAAYNGLFFLLFWIVFLRGTLQGERFGFWASALTVTGFFGAGLNGSLVLLVGWISLRLLRHHAAADPSRRKAALAFLHPFLAVLLFLFWYATRVHVWALGIWIVV